MGASEESSLKSMEAGISALELIETLMFSCSHRARIFERNIIFAETVDNYGCQVRQGVFEGVV